MVVITVPGDTGLDEDMMIEKSELNELNKEVKAEGKDVAKYRKTTPATFEPILMGITRASLNTESFISESCHIEGNINGTNSVSVAGLIDGNLTTNNLKILDTAVIKGNLKAANIEIDGQVQGNIEANNIVLTSNAIIRGDICFFENLKTEKGADVDGYIKKTKVAVGKNSDSEENKQKSKYLKPTLVKILGKEAV
jgi:cytoskeletal protein CcmA (bactofilin family)